MQPQRHSILGDDVYCVRSRHPSSDGEVCYLEFVSGTIVITVGGVVEAIVPPYGDCQGRTPIP